MTRPRFRRRLLPLAAALVLPFALMAAMLSNGPAVAQEDEGHPAHIHSGTCDDLGEVVYSLSNVGPGTIKDGRTRSAGDAVGGEGAYPVDVSITTVDAPLSEITGGDFAINVHESEENIQRYVACGNVGGTLIGGDLTIGLAQLTDSGFTGIAVLHPRDEQTLVTVFLAEGLAGGEPPAEPIADDANTDADADDDAEADTDADAAPAEAAVSIENFSFSPITLDVAAGTTVTWTNNDGAPHTVTGDNGEFDSGQLDPGASYSFTFASAGTITYHCDIHPRMTGSVVVT